MTNKEREILETDYPKLKITNKTRENISKYSKLNQRLPVRIAMGKIYTDEEFKTKKERVLNVPLPGDEKKFQKVKNLFKRNK